MFLDLQIFDRFKKVSVITAFLAGAKIVTFHFFLNEVRGTILWLAFLEKPPQYLSLWFKLKWISEIMAVLKHLKIYYTLDDYHRVNELVNDDTFYFKLFQIMIF